MRPLQPAIIKQIKQLRIDGLSYDKISKLLNIDRESATKYSKGIILSNDQKHYMRALSLRKYNYISSIFTNENEISYYLLGAFITDGHITKCGKNSMQAVLTSADEDWLKSIGKLICPDKPINKNKNSKAFNLILTDKIIYDWFQSHGCTERKSLNVKFPSVPKKYLKDFIRGCFDGDGCLCIYTNKTKKSPGIYSYIASASPSFIKDFQKILQVFDIKTTINKIKLCNSVIDGRQIIAKHNLYRLHLSKLNTHKLCKLIYYDNCLCLKRKQEKAQKIIELCESST